MGKHCEQITTVLKQEPDFSWNFTQQDLRQFLAPVIAERRLLPQDEIQVSIEPFELMDKRGKILLRFELEKYLRPDRAGRYRSILVNCRFYPLKGYDRVCKNQLKLIDSDAPVSGKVIDDPFSFILSTHNKQPADYSSKLNISLDPKMSIGQALASTLLLHMDMIEKNLPGIKADLDTDFLHDFRIANRRSRSLVTQIKNIMPPAKEKYYKEIFSWLSNETSAHRDLDVFLLDIPMYRSMLPLEMRNDLDPLRVALVKKRHKVHARLLKVLNSEKFNKFQSECQIYLTAGLNNHFQTEIGVQPVSEIANQAIWRVYRRLLKQGRFAIRTGDMEALHDLRKTGKKLRYLLETFSCLYPKQDIEQVITHCRRLQNLLGRIVDHRVQQSYLLGLASTSAKRSGLPDSTKVCIQHLVDTFNELEEKAYDKFAGRFAGFSNPRTKKHFKTLFKGTVCSCG